MVTAIPGPRSRELAARQSATVARGVSTTLPVFITRAGGGVLVDVDGNSLIDFGAGIAVVNVGNAAEHVVCEELARRIPGDFQKRSALFNSGAEAVENAVKIARSYTRRSAVVVFDHAYHGRTNLTMALTAKNMPYKNGFGPFAPEVYRMPMAYPYRWPTGPQGEGGFIVPGDGFLAGLAEYCQANGIVFVADEIQTGFARTGAWFACEHEGVVRTS